jgi:hypothetical protein
MPGSECLEALEEQIANHAEPVLSVYMNVNPARPENRKKAYVASLEGCPQREGCAQRNGHTPLVIRGGGAVQGTVRERGDEADLRRRGAHRTRARKPGTGHGPRVRGVRPRGYSKSPSRRPAPPIARSLAARRRCALVRRLRSQ